MTATTKKILTAIIAIALIAVIVLLAVFLVQKNGFRVEEDGIVRYYENNEAVKGWKIIPHKNPETKKTEYDRYYFDADGKMQRGWFEIAGDYFYFRKGTGNSKDPGGQLMIGEAATMTIDGVYWYVTFGETGKVIDWVLDYEMYAAKGETVPTDVEIPNFGA